MTQSRISAEELQALYHGRGLTTPQIAALLGLKSPSTVNYYLRKYNIPSRSVGQAADPLRWASKIQSLFERGWSDAAIGKTLGLAQATVGRYRVRAGLYRPRGHGNVLRRGRGVRTQMIVRLRTEGLSLNAIADRLGITRAAVDSALFRASLVTRPQTRDPDGWERDYRGGMSLRQVAEKYAVTVPSILRLLRLRGVNTAERCHQVYAPRCKHALRRHENRTRGWCPACARKHLPIYAIYTRERQARIKQNGGSHTAQQWLEKRRAYDRRCAYCSQQVKRPTKDHVIPLSRGGTNDIDNIVPACKYCNARKHTGVWLPCPPEIVRDFAKFCRRLK